MFSFKNTAAISHWLWLGAIATAIVERVVKLAIEPGGFRDAVAAGRTELAVRFTAYVVLPALSLMMLSGKSWARWALLIMVGGLGTVSLVFEPIVFMFRPVARDPDTRRIP